MVQSHDATTSRLTQAMAVLPAGAVPAPEISYPVVIIGGGGCGLTAALAAHDAGAQVLVIERDPVPRGSTAMSTGLIPAAGTPDQQAAGIVDSPALLAQDIIAKTKGRTDAAIALRLAEESAPTVAWLRDQHGVPLSLVDGFTYPGHSVRRMMGTPHRTGEELMGALHSACAAAEVDILTEATVTDLVADAGRIIAVMVERPDGAREVIGAQTLILASCGFGGDPAMLASHVPEIAGAVYHGHPGNKGDAVRWGQALGAALADMGAYQGHGGLIAGHAIPLLWPVIMEGGYQVNAAGERFSNEALGYSEQAAKVNAQPASVAWTIFDSRLDTLMRQFDDYMQALAAGAILTADTPEALAAATGLPADALAETMAAVAAMTALAAPDDFGRIFAGKPALCPPFHAAKVTGALFHTQGGLVVNEEGRVMKLDGAAFPNLFAGGGAARGISGSDASGYIAGNGLLTATAFGRLAGRAAAQQALAEELA
jgi:fumarate reductase flavoprotein subunit